MRKERRRIKEERTTNMKGEGTIEYKKEERTTNIKREGTTEYKQGKN